MPAWGAAVFEDMFGYEPAIDLPGDVARRQVSAAAERLEDTIRGIRGGASAAGGQDPAPRRPPPPGAP
jgi:hypothetical protein